jgi:hypothetical protein
MDATHFDRLTRLLAGRRSRRMALASGGVSLALGVLRGNRTHAQEATPAGEGPPEVLYVQVATNGTFRPQPGAGGVTHELTLEGVTPHTVWFSDRPDRLVGTVRTADFATEPVFDVADPPNAALVAETAEGEAVVVVELTAPRYEATAGTAIYRARVLGEEPDGRLRALAGRRTERAVPEAFGPASLFVDQVACSPPGASCGGTRDCCSGVCYSGLPGDMFTYCL